MKKTKVVPVEKLLEKFDPENDAIDRRIYYGITNKKIDPIDKFSDESDGNQPSNQTMNDFEMNGKENQLLRNTFDPGRSYRLMKVGQEDKLSENTLL